MRVDAKAFRRTNFTIKPNETSNMSTKQTKYEICTHRRSYNHVNSMVHKRVNLSKICHVETMANIAGRVFKTLHSRFRKTSNNNLLLEFSRRGLGSSPIPTLPPFDYTPIPYNGPKIDEIIEKRKKFLNPAIFSYYKSPVSFVIFLILTQKFNLR